MPFIQLDKYTLRPRNRVKLNKRASKVDDGIDKAKAKIKIKKLHRRLGRLQELLYSKSKRLVLILLQGVEKLLCPYKCL